MKSTLIASIPALVRHLRTHIWLRDISRDSYRRQKLRGSQL